MTLKEKPVCTRCDGNITHPRCIAHKATSRGGGPCGSWPMHGQLVCDRHGGKAPLARAAAARRLQNNALETIAANTIYGIPRQVDPAQGLVEEYWRSAGLVAAYEQLVMGLEVDELVWGVVERGTVTRRAGARDVADAEPRSDAGGTDGGDAAGAVTEARTVLKAVPNIWVQLFNQERDRYAKLGVEIVRLGLEARRDEYIRAQVTVFAGVLLSPELGLTVEQRQVAGRLLRQLGAGDTAVIDGAVAGG